MCDEVFTKITEEHSVTIETSSRNFTEPVFAVDGTGDDKVISFYINNIQPRLVKRFDKIYLETWAKGHPREWKTYERVNSLKIVEE